MEAACTLRGAAVVSLDTGPAMQAAAATFHSLSMHCSDAKNQKAALFCREEPESGAVSPHRTWKRGCSAAKFLGAALFRRKARENGAVPPQNEPGLNLVRTWFEPVKMIK